jgi:hypothetical protein
LTRSRFDRFLLKHWPRDCRDARCPPKCAIYRIITNQEAIRAPFRVMNRYVGNLAPMPVLFPDYPAPVVRNACAERELVTMRRGMPPPPRTGGPPVTSIRNTSSPHWRGWLKPESRCLVPFNSFAEYAPEPNPETKKKDVVWFAIHDDRPRTASRASGPSSRAIAAPNRSGSRVRTTSRADPSEGHAGDPVDRRRTRRLDAMGGGQGVAAPLPDDVLRIVARGEIR